MASISDQFYFIILETTKAEKKHNQTKQTTKNPMINSKLLFLTIF